VQVYAWDLTARPATERQEHPKRRLRIMGTLSRTVLPGSRHRTWPLIIAATAVIFVTGCSTAGGTVNVTLQEWSVTPDKTEISAGSVTFEVSNTGPDDIHEFVVIKTDLAAGDLPVDSTGMVDEAGGGMEVEGEIEDIAVDGSETLTLDLAAGSYVLICNIYDDTEKEAHYQEGMRAAFTVN
jgi:uncharacterized cupredoxin-like copper-binding protein